MAEVPGSTVGRPRNPDVDKRVKDAAVELFGESGLPAVSIEAVARNSGVSKRSIYLRWSDKDTLLAEALTERLRLVTDLDTGNLRDDLLALARQLVELYIGPFGKAALRIAFDPGLGVFIGTQEYLRESQVLAARALVHRAINRGELPASISVTLLLDTICGASLNHVIGTPPRMRAAIRLHVSTYTAELVEFVMRALDDDTLAK